MENDYNNFIKFVIKKHLGIILLNESLKNYTTLHIGGKCFCVYKPNSILSLKKAYQFLKQFKIDFFILGNGSNLLISDDYHHKVFISLKDLKNYQIENNILTVESGMLGNVLAMKISKGGYSGLEFLAGIPGTIGGLIYMNAGAWNKSISEILESITYINELGEICEMTNILEKGFAYRKSPFQKRKVIIVSCKIRLNSVISPISVFERYKMYLEKKKATQPLSALSAGCVFKNTSNSPAWKLITDAIPDNLSIGGAVLSNIHHNFIINKSNATFLDAYNLLKLIQEEVFDKYNIHLEVEWNILK